jgi:hypothetical protein
VDQPVILSRLLGPDGLRGPGARISLLLPFRWYSEVLGGAQNANGETAVSFLGAGDAEPIAGYEAVGRETDSIDDMLYTTRWLNSWSISDTLTLNLGASGAFGPNASGDRNRTRIAGADVYALWKPVVNRRGWPFVRLQAEVLQRWYQAGDGTPRKTLIDRGAYTQIVWGFFERWAAGLRWDGARGFGGLVAPNADPLRDARQRLSPNLSFYPTEFSKLRLQYNRDWAQATADAHSVWLQIEVAIGAHGAHQF